MNRLAPSRRIAAIACATAVAVGAGGAASATLAYLFGVPSQHEFSHTASGDASGTLTVRAPAGGVDLTISPSPDDRLHVSASGTYRGGPPVVTVGESGAAVDIVCPEGQFWRCSLGVTVAVPSRADVTAEGLAGSITMTDLHGAVTATTTTGDVTIRRHHGPVRAQTAEGKSRSGRLRHPNCPPAPPTAAFESTWIPHPIPSMCETPSATSRSGYPVMSPTTWRRPSATQPR
ncbi:hypothetical protein BTZ20_0962 [Rhodococcus sp. MTM3W5.2]|uniref:hypothetical protein n=1 Tax=Rhodococcus sp. MTM3W5.2 TaxID=1805827 RepID=UPI0009794B68|nr:hypothetical protein [Rhodococcus sp. MTM3W5.2]AQA23658.1 hypothetical protein BTZ20_0962 [Rhodococcus sp. MTM3W5.2]